MSMKLDGEAGMEASQSLLASIHPLDVLKSRDFLIEWLSPFALFLLVTFFYAFGFMKLPSICILLSLASLLASANALSLRHRGPRWCPIAVGTFSAAVAGTILGLYVFDQYSVFPMFYDNSRTYTNVVPSQPSAAVADAGKIVFTADSLVDSANSVSFITEYGDLYCVAPIRDNSDIRVVEFWVAGTNCCGERGDFWCDSANDPQAHAGIVMFENNGFFGATSQAGFEKARLKAEATFNLRSVSKPMYVRWVREDNMEMVAGYYRSRAAGFLVAFILLYSAASFGLTWAFHRPRLVVSHHK